MPVRASIWLTVLLAILLGSTGTVAGQRSPAKEGEKPVPYPAMKVDIAEYLRVFEDSCDATAYSIAVCADVPNNRKPLQVAHHQETGHVFVVLRKIVAEGDTVSRVFGFYPKAEMTALFFKKSRSVIKDNSQREHDVAITKELSRAEFDQALSTAKELAGRKYHRNKFNCYDYALMVFNAVAGDSPLRISRIRFPFIFGRGGSPCAVFRDFREIKLKGLFWHDQIVFGQLLAPVSTGRMRDDGEKLAVNQ